MSNKKYKIIDTILADAPYGYINWLTISFLTPQKEEKTKYLDVVGFKVHNGYTNEESAKDDAKRLKTINNNHDIFAIELGKIYSWDDISKSDNIEYDNTELNELERTRRENADKLKLMREQFSNEKANPFPVNTRMEDQLKKMRDKLHREGKISQREYDLMQETNKPLNEIKVEASERERMEGEIEEAWKTDLLLDNDPVPLKFGCISIFTPKNIGNLKQPCFKIRGLFQVESEMEERLSQLEKLYPNDAIYKLEIGKWMVYSDSKTLQGEILLKQLNYAMKMYLDMLATEKKNYEERKDKMVSEAETQANVRKHKNKKERREEKKNKRKPQEAVSLTSAKPNPNSTKPPVPEPTVPKPKKDENHSLRKGTDETIIKNMMDFLNDDELRGKFETEPQDKSNAVAYDL